MGFMDKFRGKREARKEEQATTETNLPTVDAEKKSAGDLGKEPVKQGLELGKRLWKGLKEKLSGVAKWSGDRLVQAVGATESAVKKSAKAIAEGAKTASEFAYDVGETAVEAGVETVVAGTEAVKTGAAATKEAGVAAKEGLTEGLSEAWEEALSQLDAGKEFFAAAAKAGKDKAKAGAEFVAMLAGVGILAPAIAAGGAKRKVESMARGAKAAIEDKVDLGRANAGRMVEAAGAMIERGIDVAGQFKEATFQKGADIYGAAQEGLRNINRKGKEAYNGMLGRINAARDKFDGWRNKAKMQEIRVDDLEDLALKQYEQIQRLQAQLDRLREAEIVEPEMANMSQVA